MKNISFVLLVCVVWLPLIANAEDNAVYKELVTQGIALANGKTITLPEPVMVDGLKADQQQTIMTQVGPKAKSLLQSYLQGSSNAEFERKYTDEKGDKSEDSIGRRIDLYFVAKGKFKVVASEGFIKDQIAQQKQNGNQANQPKRATNGKVEFYTDAELKQRNLLVTNKNTLKDRYAHALVDLIGEVQVSGSGYGVETITDDSITMAFKLDPRLAKDAQFPNQYQTIKINAAGAPVLADPKPYAGFGGYAKITKLEGSEDKVFVEYHLVFDEPYEWFNGTTALVSKLDFSFQADIRKFRRNLLAYEKNLPAAAAPQPNSAK
ncbi:MAG TPA: hypothetical protein VFE46_04640 [Pirellulales bacterium]|jgi:hypothetical protein|nr:hypothetical protein [Pirellulales bacterium]